MTAMQNSTDLSAMSAELCGDFEVYTLPRVIFLATASLLASLGTLGNLSLIYIFSAKRNPRTPPTLYPTVLAVLDMLMCALYILLFGVDAAVVFLHVRELFILYHAYIVPAYVVSRITQLAIPIMLIFATLERFVWISQTLKSKVLKGMYSKNGRQLTVIISLTTCIALRVPTAFAVVVHHFPNCTDFFRSKSTGPADWVLESAAYHFFDFHLLSIAQTFIPFFVLVLLNLIIVVKLVKNRQAAPSSVVIEPRAHGPKPRKFQKTKSLLKGVSSADLLASMREKNSSVRSAVYAMLAIVTSYLMSNILHLILTILERSKSSLLRDPDDPYLASKFHTIFSDTVSFVYMFTSAIRIIIYCSCNAEIRKDLRVSLLKQFNFSRKSVVV